MLGRRLHRVRNDLTIKGVSGVSSLAGLESMRSVSDTFTLASLIPLTELEGLTKARRASPPPRARGS